MTLINRIKRAVFLDKKVYSEIAEDKDALVQAIIVVLLTMVISEIVFWIWYDSSWGSYNKIGRVWSIISSLEFYLILILALPIWFIGTGIMHIVAKLLGGKADFVSYFKAIGFARVPATLGTILFISWFISAIWTVACYFTAIKVVHRLSTEKAIIVAVIVPIILVGLIMEISFRVYSWMELGAHEGSPFMVDILTLLSLSSLL